MKEHIFDTIRTDIEEEVLSEMKKVAIGFSESKISDQTSNIPHEFITDINNLFQSYFITYWRYWVTICCIFVSVLFVRSIIFLTSPVFSLLLKKKGVKKYTAMQNKVEEIPLKDLKTISKSNESIVSKAC